VDAVKDHLETQFPAMITALNAEYNDEITLGTPVKTFLGMKSLKSIPAGDFPALYIFTPTGRDVIGEMTPGTTQVVIETEPLLAIGVLVMEQDREALDPQLRRYCRALEEILLTGMASLSDPLRGWILSTNEPWEWDIVSAAYSDSQDSPFVGDLTLTMRGWRMETRS